MQVSARIPKRRVAHVRASKLIPPDTREVHFVWRGKSMIARGPLKELETRLVARSMARRLGLKKQDLSLHETTLRSDMGELYRAVWGDGDGFHQEHVYVFGPHSAHFGLGMDPKTRPFAMRQEARAAKELISRFGK